MSIRELLELVGALDSPYPDVSRERHLQFLAEMVEDYVGELHLNAGRAARRSDDYAPLDSMFWRLMAEWVAGLAEEFGTLPGAVPGQG